MFEAMRNHPWARSNFRERGYRTDRSMHYVPPREMTQSFEKREHRAWLFPGESMPKSLHDLAYREASKRIPQLKILAGGRGDLSSSAARRVSLHARINQGIPRVT